MVMIFLDYNYFSFVNFKFIKAQNLYKLIFINIVIKNKVHLVMILVYFVFIRFIVSFNSVSHIIGDIIYLN